MNRPAFSGKTIIIVVGPTAVGKTAFAIALAKILGTQIISADSRQCYRELNIGVAKPSEEELKAVKHYFINSHSVYDSVNAATFEQYALDSAAEIFHSNDVAAMVGGTGLYVRAFCEGLDAIPAIDNSIRSSIIAGYEEFGLAWLQTQVREKDPAFWANAEQQNPQRLMRALEVKESTGYSILHYRHAAKKERPFNIVTLGLELPRAELYHRINARVESMIEQGLTAEAEALLPLRHLNALQTVGYQELFGYFDGAVAVAEAVDAIKKNTRHYAKRQLTWFKREKNIRWLSPENHPELILRSVLQG